MAGALVRSALGSLLALTIGLGAGCSPAAAPAAPTARPAAQAAPAATSAPAAPPTSAPAPTPAALQKVRYGTRNIFGDVGFFLGMDEGYYAEQGIELDLTSFDSAANMVAPLATNQLEAGGGAPSAGLYNALRSGVNVRIVADKGHSDPTP